MIYYDHMWGNHTKTYGSTDIKTYQSHKVRGRYVDNDINSENGFGPLFLDRSIKCVIKQLSDRTV